MVKNISSSGPVISGGRSRKIAGSKLTWGGESKVKVSVHHLVRPHLKEGAESVCEPDLVGGGKEMVCFGDCEAIACVSVRQL